MNSTPLPSVPKITYDTLLQIISLYLSAREAVPLIATCQVLYHEGAKIALRKPVMIFDAAQLASFLKFLHAEYSSRCRHLRQLELEGFRAEAELAQGLLETLPLLVRLQSLRLVNAEELLLSNPALPTAFAMLTSLQHVSVGGSQKATCAFLSSLRAPLVSTTVDFVTDCNDDSAELWDCLTDAECPRYHPTALLVNAAPSLEELRCVSCGASRDWNIAVPTRIYPNMRKLSIEVHEFPLQIDPFVRAFPNLTHLHVETQRCHRDLYAEDVRVSREANVRQQLTSCGTWTHLEQFTGGQTELYTIGLTCRIGRITIVDDVDDELGLDMLETALRHARPLHLKLKGIKYSLLETSEASFISMLRSDDVFDLVNLDVCINFEEEDWNGDWRATVHNLVSALAGLRLTYLALRFNSPDPDLSPTKKDDLELGLRLHDYHLSDIMNATRAPLDTAELLSSLDIDALVARLKSIPSLKAALVVLPSTGTGGEKTQRLITMGTSQLPGREQWRSWLHSKDYFEL